MESSDPFRMRPAEVAQARLFDTILQAQFVKLNQLIPRMPGIPDQDLGEIQRLRDALRLRFLVA